MFAEEHGGQMAGVGGARGRALEEEVRERMEGGNTRSLQPGDGHGLCLQVKWGVAEWRSNVSRHSRCAENRTDCSG